MGGDKLKSLKLLEKVVSQVLNKENINLTLEMVAPDVEGWDSLNHVQIIFYCEQELNVEFQVQEIQDLNTIGDLVNLIKKYI